MGLKGFIFLALITASASAQDLGQTPFVKTGRGRKFQTPPTTKASADQIVGHCVVLPGGGNLIESACVDIILILNDSHGTEVVRTRTDKNGNFTFEAKPEYQYAIVPGSRFYEVSSPTGLIQSHQKIELKLTQK